QVGLAEAPHQAPAENAARTRRMGRRLRAGPVLLQHDADRADGHLALHEHGHAPVVVGEPDHESPLLLEDAAGLEDGLDRHAIKLAGGRLDLLAAEDLDLEREALSA